MNQTVAGERRWIRYVWLVYLVFAFFPLFLGRSTTAWDWAITLLGIALFLPVYLRGYDCQGPGVLPRIGAIAALGVVFSQFNPNLSSFFIYAAAAAGQVGNTRLAWRIVAGMAALALLTAGLTLLRFGWYAEVFYFALPVFFTVFIGALNIFEAERERAARKLLAAQEENQRLAAIAERERIARDLHDLLGHTLSVITLKAELAAKLSGRDPEGAAREMREVERISREATKQVREAVQGYKTRGLSGELAGVKLALEAAEIRFDYYAEPLSLPPAQETVLAMALREAVTNVIRHSGAKSCTVRLREEGEGVRLEVLDDGRGGLPSGLPLGLPHEGSGLAGMRARVEAQGGTLEHDRADGYRLSVFLPAAPPKAAPAPGELKPQMEGGRA